MRTSPPNCGPLSSLPHRTSGAVARLLLAFILSTASLACAKDGPTGAASTTSSLAPTPAIERSTALENQTAGVSDWVTPAARWASESRMSMYATPYRVVAPDSISVFINSDRDSKVSLQLYR